MPEVSVPKNFRPRSYQARAIEAMYDGSVKRAVWVWHRRAGKDKTALNFTIRQMFSRVGTYYYFFPTYKQGKKILWDGMDREGYRFMDHFPKEFVIGTNDTEMQVECSTLDGRPGSIFQIVGTDNMDFVVGTNPIGCVFSEYAIQNPRAWDLTRPILRENEGWSIFCYTPRGANHGKRLYEAAKGRQGWYASLLTVRDTLKDGPGETGRPVISEADIEDERATGMSEELIQQEYYCSFEGVQEGSYYADQLRMMRSQNRIRPLSWDADYAVDTAWDIGMDDATAIVFCQTIDGVPYIIDAYRNASKGLEHYLKVLSERPYVYGKHYAPWDMRVKDWSTGQTRLQAGNRMGVHFTITPKLGLKDGIDTVRRFLTKAMIHSELSGFLDSIHSYRREYDEVAMSYSDTPVHDWASDYADALRTLAVNWHPETLVRAPYAITQFNPFTGPPQAEEYEREFNPFLPGPDLNWR